MLGPLLFSLFIADMRVNLKFAEGMIFADEDDAPRMIKRGIE